jgi:hypothetical protein
MASQTPLSDSESVIPGDILQGALEKIESRTAAGEFTPNGASSPRPSIADDVEKGEQSTGDGPITHRPTGIKVHSDSFQLKAVVLYHVFDFGGSVPLLARQHRRRGYSTGYRFRISISTANLLVGYWIFSLGDGSHAPVRSILSNIQCEMALRCFRRYLSNG